MTTALAVTAAVAALAQTRFDYRRYAAPEQSQADRAETGADVECTAAYIFARHPELRALDYSKARRNTVISVDYDNWRTHGDWLHYNGNRTTSIGATAGSETMIKGVGLLYGSATYQRARQHAMFQNYAVRPADYAPYTVGDTVSTGIVQNERYVVSGGLSMGHGRLRYGVSGFYEGIAAAKEDQPRRSVYSYWFRLAFGAALNTPRWVAALKVYPEINKQSISASSTVSTYKYLAFYGFGQWNRKESSAGYSYRRQMQILGIGSDAVLRMRAAGTDDWDITANAGYNYRRMQTEESSFKNLYLTSTHRLTHNIVASRQFGGVQLHLRLSGEAAWRNGDENIYENQKQDASQSLYDYVRVGTNKLYSGSDISESLAARLVVATGNCSHATLNIGAVYDRHHEQYDMPYMVVENTGITPSAGLGYFISRGRNRLDWDATFSMRKATGNEYAVTQNPSASEHVQAYVPYLIRGEENWRIESSLVAARALKHGEMGISARISYTRRTSAPYIKGYAIPVCGYRNERLFSVEVFYAF